MVVLEIKDIPGAVSFVTGLLAHNNKDISTMQLTSQLSQNTHSVTIETADELESILIDQLRKFEVVAKVVVLDKF